MVQLAFIRSLRHSYRTTAPASRLGRQVEEVVVTLDALGVQFALIGDLAMASYNIIRATQDLNLLVDAQRGDQIDAAFVRMGYRCAYRSREAANYRRRDEGIDLIYAGRPIARRLLADAMQSTTAVGMLRVVSAEGLIGFKLQALVNDPRRTQDLEDIRDLLRAQGSTLNLAEVREYFALFGRESLLDELLNEIRGPLA